MLYARPAKVSDCHYLAPRLREADVNEVLESSGKKPLESLLSGLKFSDKCWTICTEQDEPIGIFGVALLPGNQPIRIGSPWMLATDSLVDHQVAFLRESKKWIDKVGEPYDLLFNLCDSRNTVHIRWLKWCGFSFVRKMDNFGLTGVPFYQFMRITNV